MARDRNKARKQRLRYGIRKKLHGTADRPRMCVFRSNTHTYVQIINDEAGHTLVSVSSNEKGFSGEGKIGVASEVGKRAAERAAEKGISSVVFDRNIYRFHGRVKAIAEGAREGGLKF